MTRILAINGSYRDDGVTDHGVETMTAALTEAGATVEEVRLRDYPIEFCLNCRSCTQQPGDAPGECVHNDGMRGLVEKIEQADGFILAAPTNLGSVTAVFKRFMERLIVYVYWPWGKPAPVFRKATLPKKKAVIISSSAAPGPMGRWSPTLTPFRIQHYRRVRKGATSTCLSATWWTLPVPRPPAGRHTARRSSMRPIG